MRICLLPFSNIHIVSNYFPLFSPSIANFIPHLQLCFTSAWYLLSILSLVIFSPVFPRSFIASGVKSSIKYTDLILNVTLLWIIWIYIWIGGLSNSSSHVVPDFLNLLLLYDFFYYSIFSGILITWVLVNYSRLLLSLSSSEGLLFSEFMNILLIIYSRIIHCILSLEFAFLYKMNTKWTIQFSYVLPLVHTVPVIFSVFVFEVIFSFVFLGLFFW